MNEDNGIIVIQDQNKLKQKYKVVTCFSILSTNKEYIVYSKGKEDEGTILVYISEIEIKDKNEIDLITIKSESILIEIGILLKQIYQKNIDEKKYKLKALNLNKKFTTIGYKNIKLEPDYYKYIKKDYNSNKKEREIIGEYQYIKEFTIEKVKTPEKDFCNQFKIDKKYINAIKKI